MFVALEVLSLPLYLLCGLARRRRLLSQEAAVKYFLLGAFSSAFFLFGIAMLYGYSGLGVAARRSPTAATGNVASATLLLAGIALLGVGLLFKIGAVPFHGWKPDVYQGAPTPVTALMAVLHAGGRVRRAAARVLRAFGQLTWDWRPVDVGRRHPDHAGRRDHRDHPDRREAAAGLLLDRARRVRAHRRHRGQTAPGLSSSLFYLAAYGFATIGAFAVVTLVRDPAARPTHLSQLGRPGPPVAAGGRRLRAASCSRSPASR